MRNLLVLIIIVVSCLVSETQAKEWFPAQGNPVNDSVYLATTPVITIGIQTDDGPVYLIYLELTKADRQEIAPAGNPYYSAGETGMFEAGIYNTAVNASIMRLLPEPMTIVYLGLAGLMSHRKRNA